MKSMSTIKFIVALSLLVFFLVTLGACANTSVNGRNSSADQNNLRSHSIEHRVSFSGETLALIASWYTGKSTNWTYIRDANPGLRPERINLGQVIRIPGHLVVQRSPMPRRFLQDAVVRSPKRPSSGNTESAESTKEAGAVASTNSTEEIPADKGADSQAYLNELLADQPGAANSANSQVAPAADVPTAVGLDSLGSNAAPAVAVEAPPTNVENEAPPTGDSEREKLLDELLSQ